MTRLRRFTQLDLQPQWRVCIADLPIAIATQSTAWSHWETAQLNDKAQITWARGQQVIWLGQAMHIPEQLQGYPLAGLRGRLAISWWAERAEIFVNGQLVQTGDLFDCATRLLVSKESDPAEVIEIALRLVSPGS